MSTRTLIIILFILLFIMFIIVGLMLRSMVIMNRRYSAIMSGKKGSDLEKIIRLRFKEMDKVKANAKRVTKEHKEVREHLHSCISKIGFVRYDAFDKMTGKLSFAIALLSEENTGIMLNAMHSREGCYTYAKEIIKGKSYIPLSSEEKEALENAKTVDEEINDLTGDYDLDFDVNE